jgi:hypothetical protein
MRQVSVLLFAVLFLAQAQSAVELRLEIGTMVPKSLIRINPKPHELIMTAPAQMDRLLEYRAAGVKYILGYDEQSRKISYIYTDDRNFRTSSGLHVGSSIQITREQVRAFPGWLAFGPKTEDGWSPEIGFDSRLELVDIPTNYERLGTKFDDAFARAQSISVIVHGFAKHK